ncbi:MAG: hypothetical protein WA160_01110 [Pseudobdellovibrio sp.]
MKKVLTSLVLVIGLSTSIASHAGGSSSLAKFDPKIKGLTKAMCSELNKLGGTLYGKIAIASIDLQNESVEDQEKFAQSVEAPMQQAKANLFDICYTINF